VELPISLRMLKRQMAILDRGLWDAANGRAAGSSLSLPIWIIGFGALIKVFGRCLLGVPRTA
jgi:hypothetical protein